MAVKKPNDGVVWTRPLVIGKHIRNIFAEGEIDKKRNGQKMPVPNSDKTVEFYSLDVVLAVGYRVKSPRGTLFRQWATQVLHEYLQKGFAMNDDFLKNFGGGIYWKELLERIRDIRASEKVMYIYTPLALTTMQPCLRR